VGAFDQRQAADAGADHNPDAAGVALVDDQADCSSASFAAATA